VRILRESGYSFTQVKSRSCRDNQTWEMIMRTPLLAVTVAVVLTGGMTPQGTGNTSVPTEIGNRAHGFSYQPTRSQVIPRERAAGVRPSAAQQAATDQELQQIARALGR
jgi:hypothetical protein